MTWLSTERRMQRRWPAAIALTARLSSTPPTRTTAARTPVTIIQSTNPSNNSTKRSTQINNKYKIVELNCITNGGISIASEGKRIDRGCADLLPFPSDTTTAFVAGPTQIRNKALGTVSAFAKHNRGRAGTMETIRNKLNTAFSLFLIVFRTRFNSNWPINFKQRPKRFVKPWPSVMHYF